jgi:hypothetical protein
MLPARLDRAHNPFTRSRAVPGAGYKTSPGNFAQQSRYAR